MRAIVQRVKYSKLSIDNKLFSKINFGLLVLLGVHKEDNEIDIDYIVKKIIGLRIFSDDEGKMNLSINDVKGQIMVVSQFTLYGDARKGNRPSFIQSAGGEFAKSMYENVVERLRESVEVVNTGKFGADMQIEFINDGPVTIQLDSSKLY